MANFNATHKSNRFSADGVLVFSPQENPFHFGANGDFGGGGIALQTTPFAPSDFPSDNPLSDPTTFNEDTTSGIWEAISINGSAVNLTANGQNIVTAPFYSCRAMLTGATDPDVIFVANI